MLSKLNAVADKYHELEALLSDPSVMADMEKWQRYTREHAALTPIIEAYDAYRQALATIEEDKEMLAEADAEMKEMLAEEIAEAEAERDRLAEQLPILLLPRDPNDDKNVIVEIRGGVGGEEAALFAASLFRMYARYAERQGWRTEILSSNPTEIGGFKEVSFLVNGAGAYSRLKSRSRGGVSIQPLSQSQCSPRRRRSRSRSIRMICASTPTVPQAPADSMSTVRRRRSASRISRRALLCSARMKSPSSRIVRRR